MIPAADEHVYFVGGNNRMYRVAKLRAIRLLEEVAKGAVDVDLSQFHAVEVGEAPIFLDALDVETAKLLARDGITFSRSEVRRETIRRAERGSDA